MPKIIVPHFNTKEKAMFDKLNITLIDSISAEEFEQEIIEYLNQHNLLFLSTCRDNDPRCTPLEYFNNGLTVHVFSEGGGKFANLKVNSKICYGIADSYNPVDNFFDIKGLQVWGTASVFKRNDDPEKFNEIHHYARHTEELKKRGMDVSDSSFNFNVITIEPTKIRYVNLRKGFRNVMWAQEAES